jgi:hypothetical protein
MPKLLNNSANMDVGNIPGLRGYQFSAIRTDKLGASEYTLVTIAVDVSGSVLRFKDLLIESLKKAIEACRKSPRSANIMLRVITFASDVEEVHGFKPLMEVDLASDYENISTGGDTALFDASSSSIGAMTEYGRILMKQDYGVNGILFIITDGGDNISKYGAEMVKEKADEAVSGEVLESFLSVLIGINAKTYQGYLTEFQQKAGLTQYMDAGNATPGNLAKLAAFVSKSVSSQANQMGTGQSASLPVMASIVI